MKAELNIPQELVDQIADRVLQKMLPLLQNQQPKRSFIAIDRDDQKDKRNITRQCKPRMLSVPESANYLGIAEKTIRNRLGLKAKNPFPVKPKHIGGRVLFDIKDLDKYIDASPAT